MTDKELREYDMIQELGESGQYNHLVSWFGDLAVYEKASGVDYRDIEAAYNQLKNQEHINIREFPFRAGYGICQDDWRIRDESTAFFVNRQDAERYIRGRAFEVNSQYIPYIDEYESGVVTRYIYNRNLGDFIRGDECKRLTIPGYQWGVYIYPEDVTASGLSLSLKDAKMEIRRTKKWYGYEDSDTQSSIDEIDINVFEHFWYAEDFFSGHEKRKTLAEKIDTLRYEPDKEHETVYSKYGTVLATASEEELADYFMKHVSGGRNLLRNYMEEQIIANEISIRKTARMNELEASGKISDRAVTGVTGVTGGEKTEIIAGEMEAVKAIKNIEKNKADEWEMER